MGNTSVVLIHSWNEYQLSVKESGEIRTGKQDASKVFRITPLYYLVTGVMGNRLSYPGNDNRTHPVIMLYDRPSGNDISTLVTLYFIFHYCGASFFVLLEAGDQSESALVPHILPGKVCLSPSESC